MDPGRLLRAVRRVRRLSQRELAELAGVRRGTVDRIESGRTPTPSFALMGRLLYAAGHLLVVTDHRGRILSLGDNRAGIADRSGRRFPAHCPIWRTATDPYWWGWYRIAWSPEDTTMPEWTYSPKRISRHYEGWAGRFLQELVT